VSFGAPFGRPISGRPPEVNPRRQGARCERGEGIAQFPSIDDAGIGLCQHRAQGPDNEVSAVMRWEDDSDGPGVHSRADGGTAAGRPSPVAPLTGGRRGVRPGVALGGWTTVDRDKPFHTRPHRAALDGLLSHAPGAWQDLSRMARRTLPGAGRGTGNRAETRLVPSRKSCLEEFVAAGDRIQLPSCLRPRGAQGCGGITA
jgi:hypothetical protein